MVQKINPTSNYYELLGVSVKATTAEIKDAYRRLALELHPDVNADPDDHERFRLVADAYRVLLDPQMRKKYDTMRLLSFGWPITRLRDTVANPVAFNQLMNKVGTMLAVASGIVRKPVGEPGRDMTLGTTLSFWESFQGVERRFEYKREIDCADCKGSGFAKVAVCEICHGAGRLRSDFMPMVGKRCPRCAARAGSAWKTAPPARARGASRTTTASW